MISIEELLYSGYIKYDRLTNILPDLPPGSFLDIYIDMSSLVKGLYSQNIEIKNYKSVTSSIINLCAHYRQYFTYKEVDTRFFIVYSKNCAEINKKYYSDYNSKMAYAYQMKSQIEDVMIDNIQLLNILCPYLPDIHFKFSDNNIETGAIILDIISKVNPTGERFNMVISKDLMNYQLCAFENIFLLRPKKNRELGDISYIVYCDNLISTILKERKVQTQNTFISCGLSSLLLALSSVPERNIKCLFNTNVAVSIIETAITDYKLQNDYSFHIKSLWEALKGYNKIYELGETIFEFRYKAIDLKFQSMVYGNMAESELLDLNNLYDPDSVRMINDKYFRDNPLDLNAL